MRYVGTVLKKQINSLSMIHILLTWKEKNVSCQLFDRSFFHKQCFILIGENLIFSSEM